MVEQAAKAAVRELKDAEFTWIENMVRRATASDGDLDRGLFEPIAKGCTDYSKYGLMLKALFKRMFHLKYPVHIMKALELMKYLIGGDSALAAGMKQQLKEDTRSSHLKDLETLTTYSDSKWSMTIRQLAHYVIDVVKQADSTPASALSPGTGSSLARSFSFSQSSEPSPTSMSSQTSTSSTLSTGYDPKIRVKLDGVYILDCTKDKTGNGDLEAIQAIDFYMDSMKTVPVWHTLTPDQQWRSSKDVLKQNLTVQTVPTAKGGRVNESTFEDLLSVTLTA